MDFETAVGLSREIEEKFRPGVIVIGFRRQRDVAANAWAIDLLVSHSSHIVTLDEKDDWEVRLERALPQA